MKNTKTISIKNRVKILESMAHPPIMEGVRIETIEKAIQELYDRIGVIEKELIEPLQRLQRESKSK